MFAATGRRTSGSNPNRWLLLAGAGLLALGVVLRLMLDIGRTGASTPDDAVGASDSAAPPPAAVTPGALATEVRPDTIVASPDTVIPKPVPAPVSAPVKPSPAPPPAAAPARVAAPVATPPATGAWVVQLGVFSSPDNAKRVVSEAQRLGFVTEVLPVGTAGRVRVRTAGHANRAEAQAAADSLNRHLRLNAVVLKP